MGKSKIESIPSPVSQAIILICDKCGRKMDSDEDKNPARVLQKQLKSEMKDKFGKGYARAVTSSCLDICPKDRIAIGIARVSKGTEFFLVEGQDRNADTAAVLEKLGSQT